jgi:Rod binding domain-containing protein
MDALRLETMSMRPSTPETKERDRAGKVAEQFETVFVRTMVASLRQSASLGEEGMFGSGPGSDTYTDWFDQNLAEQISKSGRVGIKQQIMTDFERDGALTPLAVDEVDRKVREANLAANRNAFAAINADKGAMNVLL